MAYITGLSIQDFQMNSPRIIPAIVRAFFSSFVEGIVEGSLPEANGPQSVEPRQMKQLLLDHYEEMAQFLYESVFDAIAIVNYPSHEQLEQRLRETDPASLNAMSLMQHACRTDKLFNLMADEYRRNFYAVLQGHVMSIEEYFEVINEDMAPLEAGKVSSDIAIRAMVIAVIRGYQSGRKAVKAHTKPANVVCIYRLLADNMQTLLHNSPVNTPDDIDLNELFLAVCKTPENMNTMLENMQRVMQSVAEE